jgi:hypothetical protein
MFGSPEGCRFRVGRTLGWQSRERVAVRRPRFLCSRAKAFMPRGIIPNLDAPGHQCSEFHSPSSRIALPGCSGRASPVGSDCAACVDARGISPECSTQRLFMRCAPTEESSVSTSSGVARKP